MRVARRPLVSLAALLVAALLLPLVPAAPAHAAPALRVSPTNPVAGEVLRFTGKLPTRAKRPIQLQYWTGKKWAVLTKGSTQSTGAFTLKTKAASTRKFRAFAPKTSRFKAITTATRTVKTVKASASLNIVRAPVGQSRTGVQNLTPFAVTFKPARPGRGVVLERASGSSWTAIAKGVQDSRGGFTFNVKVANASYRATTVSANGAPAARTAVRTPVRRTEQFNDDFVYASKAEFEKVWSYRAEGQRQAGANRRCSQSSRDSVSLENGSLLLTTSRIDPTSTDFVASYAVPDANGKVICPNGQFYNGHIGTHGTDRFNFNYGIMAARIKAQPQAGHHGGFWSQPVKSQDPDGAEIDAVEYYGDNYVYLPKSKNPQTAPVQHGIYWGDNVDKVVKDRRNLLAKDKTFSNTYNVFSVEWTPSQYIFRINGHETWRTRRGVSSVDQYLILSLLSSEWEMQNLPKSGAIAPMHVDWVRVW
ncbi:MAG TPA: glycoside hydrolase family 16 protein [Egibacteraceae bacterium]|nr:glycoside hydrolase family 16 protein [Egibacteraceae bacterium]